MGGSKLPNGSEKRKRSKKKKSRTEVLSSDSESEVEQKKSRKDNDIEAINVTSEPAEKASKKSKKNEGKDSEPTSAASSEVEDAVMPAESVSSNVERPEEDFTSIYLRKITTELADDLDKVREANDFTNRSLPMLIHALKQGESIFSAEEKRRVIGTSGM